MKDFSWIISLLVVAMASFLLGWGSAPTGPAQEMQGTRIIPRDETRKFEGEWGYMDIYTEMDSETFGTTHMLTAQVKLVPGQALHAAHNHSEEEFLLITEGTGKWHLKGEEMEANTDDLIYVRPWDMHGLTNTGKDTLSFFVIRWNSKGVEIPKEPKE